MHNVLKVHPWCVYFIVWMSSTASSVREQITIAAEVFYINFILVFYINKVFPTM